jgi:hypothetical protein
VGEVHDLNWLVTAFTNRVPATGVTGARGESPSLRRLLIDMIEEYARHVGHADLIRESVDGLTGEDPPR